MKPLIQPSPKITPPSSTFNYLKSQITARSLTFISHHHPTLLDLAHSGTLVVAPKEEFGPVPTWRAESGFVEPDEIWVIGTTHLGIGCGAGVERVVREVGPESVVVELCRSRHGVFLFACCFELGSCMLLLTVKFRAARKVAEVGTQIVLGDRPVEITESSKDVSPFELYEQPNLTYPSLLQPLVHERDTYLAWSLKRSKAVNQNKRVVGVIGKGHMNGVLYALISDLGDLRFRDLVGERSSNGSSGGWIGSGNSLKALLGTLVCEDCFVGFWMMGISKSEINLRRLLVAAPKQQNQTKLIHYVATMRELLEQVTEETNPDGFPRLSKAKVNDYYEKIESIASMLAAPPEPFSEAPVEETRQIVQEQEPISPPFGLRKRSVPTPSTREDTRDDVESNSSAPVLDSAAHVHIQKHRKLQEDLTEEMVELAQQLKENSLMMSRSLQNTEKILDSTEKAVEQSLARTGHATARAMKSHETEVREIPSTPLLESSSQLQMQMLCARMIVFAVVLIDGAEADAEDG
ncbi:hypothetical protein AKJ16_DCAP09704 [Drosera capensis]